ncbi:hypothetical protein WDW37_09640 [Bdellovibrionota bacterium FG-1]
MTKNSVQQLGSFIIAGIFVFFGTPVLTASSNPGNAKKSGCLPSLLEQLEPKPQIDGRYSWVAPRNENPVVAEVQTLHGLVKTSQLRNETAGARLSAPERSVLTRALRKQVARVRGTGELSPSQLRTVGRAEALARIIEGADRPLEIRENVPYDDGTSRVHSHSFGQQRPKLSEKMVQVDPHFNPTNPKVPLKGLAQLGGQWILPELQAGSMHDGHYTGDPRSRVNHPPSSARYQILDQGKPFDPPPPMSIQDLRFREGTPVERLAQILQPGEHATKIAQGGGNAVFITHPAMPDAIRNQDWSAQIKWAREHRFRLLKVALDHRDIPGLTRRDYLMRWISHQIARRVRFDRKPLISVVEKSDTRFLQLGITEEPFSEGMSAYDIQSQLDHYDSSNCNAACKKSMVDLFEYERLPHPDEMKQRIGALEQAHRDHYAEGLRMVRSNDVTIIANESKITRNGKTLPIEMATDYNHGQNHIWNPDQQNFDEIDR